MSPGASKARNSASFLGSVTNDFFSLEVVFSFVVELKLVFRSVAYIVSLSPSMVNIAPCSDCIVESLFDVKRVDIWTLFSNCSLSKIIFIYKLRSSSTWG